MKIHFKLITILLLLTLVMGTINFPVVLAAPLVVGEELINNGNLEQLDADGIPLGRWQTQKNWDPKYTYITQNKDGNGSNILKVEWNDDEVDRSYARYVLTGMQPGGYELNVDVVYKMASDAGTGFRILAEFYRAGEVDSSSTYIENERLGTFNGQSNDRWVPVKANFTAPEGTEQIVIWFLLGTKGEAWIDNLSCKFSAGPDPYSMFTDQAIYYTDDSVGTSKVIVHNYYKPDSEEYNISVDYSLGDGKEILAQQTNIKPDPETGFAEFKFDPSLMEDLLERYVLKAVVKNASGEIIREFEENIIRTERPKNLKSDGTLLVDGKPFYPVIGYLVTQEFDKAMPMGINTIHDLNDYPGNIEKKLDAAHERGLKVIVHLCNLGPSEFEIAGGPTNFQTCMEWVDQLKNHPALLAWDMRDEPLGVYAEGSEELAEAKEWLLNGYIGIRERDPNHPIYLLDYNPALFKESQKYGDIFTTDVYVTGNTKSVTTGLQQAMQVVDGRKPVYQISQTYVSNRGYGIPTIDDIRGCVYRTFEAGAKGFGYFSITKSGYSGPEAVTYDMDIWDYDVYNDILKFAQDEQPELVSYYFEKKYQTFNKNDDGGSQSLFYESWIHGNDVWMVVHNRGQNEVDAKIPLYSNNGLVKINGATAQAIGGTDKNLDIQGSFLEVKMPKQKVHLYKLTPKTAVDFSQITVEVANPVIPGIGESEKVETTGTGTFSDLGGYEWASKEINELFAMGILNQSTVYTYSPAVNVTRGDAAAFLVKTLGLTAEVSDNFSDVSASTPNANEIGVLKSLGIVNGEGGNKFHPQSPITRQDLMKICARGMRAASKLPDTADVNVLNRFSDKSAIADYAIEDIAGMVETGIISGDNKGKINPKAYTTRAEVAVIMHKILNAEVLKKEEAPPVEEIVEIVFEQLNLTDEQIATRAKAMELVDILGLLKKADADTAFTREQAAMLLAKIVMNGMEVEPCDTIFADVAKDNEYSGYIAAIHEMGLMNGSGNGLFNPKKPITYHQFVKVLVDLLGYKGRANAKGGFPNGYLIQGFDLDLFDNVYLTKDMPIKVSDAAVMLRNALEAPLFDELLNEGETILSHYLKINKYEGKITANTMQTIYTPRALEAGEIVMNGIIFDAANTDADKLLGCECTLYVREDNNAGVKPVLYVESEASLLKMDVLDINIRKQKIYYTDRDGKEYSISVSPNTELLHNGQAISGAWTMENFKIDAGQITYVDNKSGKDTVFIDEYKTYVIDRVMPVTGALVFTDGSDMTFDFDDKSLVVNIENRAGKKLDFDDLKSGNVVSICESRDKKKINILVSSDTVNGIISELDDESAVINGESYKLAYCIKSTPGTYGEISLKNETEYRLDYWGKIAAVNNDAKKINYGYFCGLDEEGFGSNLKVKVKIFTTSGMMQMYDVANKVQFNGESKKSKEISTIPEFWEDGEIKQQLLIYGLNSNGEINAIETAVDGRSMTESERNSQFTMDASYNPDVDSSGIGLDRWVKYGSTLGHTYIWNSGTVIFNVPDKVMDDKYYSVSNVGSFSGDRGQLGTPIAYYDIDDKLVVPVGVVTFAGGSLTADEPEKQAACGVITDFRYGVSEDGDDITGITVVKRDDSRSNKPIEKTIWVDNEKLVFAGSMCITSEFGATKESELSKNPSSMTLDELNLGDYIQYEVNDKTGLVSALRVWFRAETPIENIEVCSDDSAFYAGSYVGSRYGEVVRVIDNGYVIKTQDYSVNLPNIREGRTLIALTSTKAPLPVVLFEKNGKDLEWTPITIEDIQIGDKVYARSDGNLISQIVCVYR